MSIEDPYLTAIPRPPEPVREPGPVPDLSSDSYYCPFPEGKEEPHLVRGAAINDLASRVAVIRKTYDVSDAYIVSSHGRTTLHAPGKTFSMTAGGGDLTVQVSNVREPDMDDDTHWVNANDIVGVPAASDSETSAMFMLNFPCHWVRVKLNSGTASEDIQIYIQTFKH